MKYVEEQPGVYCLNHGWRFSEGEHSVLPQGRRHDDVYQYVKAGGAKGPAESGYDDSAWEKIELPHDWVKKHDFTKAASPNQGYKIRGNGWYRIQFELDELDQEKQISLEFEGISGKACLYLNGTLIKRSFSAYQGFSVDITDVANYGIVPNVLAVQVDASDWEGWWYEGAGIYRNVWLVKKAPIHFAYQGVFYQPKKVQEQEWTVSYELDVENCDSQKREVEICLELYDLKEQLVKKEYRTCQFDAWAKQKIRGKIERINPELWSIENPNLYEMRAEIRYQNKIVDFLCEKIGFRSIELRADTGFYLNEANIKIKGFCNHQDHAGLGVAVPYSVKEYRVQRLKELGANAYRCAHHPDPEILSICDKIGMLVLEENRMFSSSEECLDLVRRMVQTARNHPSVIGYSIFNEEPLQGTEKGRRIAEKLVHEIKSMDGTRFVTGAFHGGFMQEDGAAPILDAVGINYNAEDYEEFHRKYPNIPLIATEITSAYMTRGKYKTDWDAHEMSEFGETCAPWGKCVPDAWKAVSKHPFVAGGFVWTGFDYLGEPTPFEWPSVSTVFGTYDRCGFEKQVCWYYKAFWKDEPIVHLISTWRYENKEGCRIKCQIVTNCDNVRVLYDEDIIFATTKVQDWKVEFELEYCRKPLKIVGYRNGQKVEEKYEITDDYSGLKVTSNLKTLDAEGYKAAVINVESNNLKMQQEKVYFEIKNGQLLGVGNGNPVSHEKELDTQRYLFDGKAQAIVKATGFADVEITVRTDSGEKTELFLPVKVEGGIPYYPTVEARIIAGWGMYCRVLDEKPSVSKEVAVYDMNSFEPITFNGSAQEKLDNRPQKYGMYKTVVQLENCKNHYLYFGNIIGNVWVYLDEHELTNRLDQESGYVEVDLPDKISGKHFLTVVVQNRNTDWGAAGITTPVMLRKRNMEKWKGK